MANSLAYYDTATITAVKSYIVQAPGVPQQSFYFLLNLYIVHSTIFLTKQPDDLSTLWWIGQFVCQGINKFPRWIQGQKIYSSKCIKLVILDLCIAKHSVIRGNVAAPD